MPQSQLPAPDLTERQRRFVQLYVDNGGRFQERAAVLAGIAPSGAAAWASRALRNPGILAELDRLARTTVRAAMVEATETLLSVMRDTNTPPAERRKAASEVLDRSGWIVAKVNESQITVGLNDETREALVREIKGLAEERGFDPRLLLGGAVDWYPADGNAPRQRRGRVIDAELVGDDDGATADEASAEPSLAGLEDILVPPASWWR